MRVNHESMIHLDLELHDCEAEFFFNGFPIRKMHSSRESFFTLVAHKYLIFGQNEIKIVIFPNETPSQCEIAYDLKSVDLSPETYAKCRLVEYPVGTTPGEYNPQAKQLLSLEWKHSSSDLKNINDLPIVVRQVGFVPQLFPVWNWQRSSIIELDNEYNEIVQSVKAMHHMFRHGDGVNFARLCKPYLHDLGIALPAKGEHALTNSLIESVNKNKSRQHLIDEFTPETLDLRILGQDNLVDLVDENWLPTIRTNPMENGWTYNLPFVLGKISGQYWVVA